LDWLRPSVVALLLANSVPLFGVLFLGWEVFPLILLFWLENLIVGAFNVLKIAFARPDMPYATAAKLFMIPFFSFHYGGFCLVHGIFVFVLFGRGVWDGHGFPGPTDVLTAVSRYHLGWAVFALVVSHGVSFVTNYLGRGEFRGAALQTLMGQPYARVVVLHLAILGGGFVILSLGSPTWALVLLVALKTGVDLKAHLRERRKAAASDTGDESSPLG
jgi:hypothetical protein